MADKIDIDKCIAATKNIKVYGRVTDNVPARMRVIEDAITSIQNNPDKALIDGYLGVKNYAGFGDQRADCDYGMGPNHGYIVFSVSRTMHARDNNVKLGDNEIYFLECVRDFRVNEIFMEDNKFNNLFDAIQRLLDARTMAERIENLIEESTVTIHSE